MKKKLTVLLCLVLSLLLLAGCTSKDVSKAKTAYSNGDYQTVIDLLAKMKKPKPEAIELLNNAKIHLAFIAGDYEQVLELVGDAGVMNEEIAPLYDQAKTAVEEAKAAEEAAAIAAAAAAKADYEFDIDAECSIDGQTHYALSKQEYDELLAEVHRRIDDELRTYNYKKNLAKYPHFESVSANGDYTRFAVVINDGRFDSPAELSLPERLSFFARMYAQYSQREVSKVTVEYKTMLGDVLNESVLEISPGVASAYVQPAEIQMTDSSSVPSAGPGQP